MSGWTTGPHPVNNRASFHSGSRPTGHFWPPQHCIASPQRLAFGSRPSAAGSSLQMAAAPSPAASQHAGVGSGWWWWLHPFHAASSLQHQQQLQRASPRSSLIQRLFSAPAVAPASDGATQQEQQEQDRQRAGLRPTHLIVLVNGLFGSSSNWDVICEQLKQQLDPQHTLLHPSTANSRFATYDGIDVCGGRLAQEVRQLVAGQPQLSRISFVAHSMGGLLARYAVGMLHNPTNGTICGLQPAHFVTLATPHCGCDADGVAQVPFIGWTSDLPLLGQQLFTFLRDISGPTAAMIFRRTGQQFFMLDGKQQQPWLGAGNSGSGSTADLPVLVQMTQDCPDRGLYFYSGLAAFKSRTCYANTDGDHLVGFANSSIRSLAGLPPLPPAAAGAKGVVLEDPLTAAFFPSHWQQLQHNWQQQRQLPDKQLQQEVAAAAAAADGGAAVQEVISQPYQPSRTWSATAAAAPAGAAAAATAAGGVSGLSDGWHELSRGNSRGKQGATPTSVTPGRWVPVQQQQQQQLSTVAVLELESAGASLAATEAVADLLSTAAAAATQTAAPVAAALQASPHPSLTGPLDSGDEVLQLETPGLQLQAAAAAAQGGSSSQDRPRRSSSGSSSSGDTAAAAEQDLASGLAGKGTAAAASRQSAVDAVAADAAALAGQGGASSRAELVAHMLYRLQELPWRRIDVSFKGARFGFAHNNIQVTRRWLNFEGVAVPGHLAQQLQIMEELLTADSSTNASSKADSPPVAPEAVAGAGMHAEVAVD